jgi:osmotically-inducible protein OsmY
MDEKTNNNAANGYWIHDVAGPKSYVAPDADTNPGVIDAIHNSFASVAWLDASRVQVSLHEDEIVLTGSVPSQTAQRQVVQCANAVAGGRHVVSHITVQSPKDELPPQA